MSETARDFLELGARVFTPEAHGGLAHMLDEIKGLLACLLAKGIPQEAVKQPNILPQWTILCVIFPSAVVVIHGNLSQSSRPHLRNASKETWRRRVAREDFFGHAI